MCNLKILFVILSTTIGTISFASNFSSVTINDSMSTTEVSNDEYIDSVVAQNMQGTQTKTFNVYGRRTSNGKYWFFVKIGNIEYDIQYIDTNKYKPFYIKIGEERWYFASKTLDFYSGKAINKW